MFHYLAIFLLLLSLVLPSLYLYSKNLDLNTLLLSIVPIVYLWALFKDSRYLIVLYPFVIIVPFILFYIYFYDTSINEQILSIVIESNWQESLSFLGANVHIYLLLFIIWLVGVSVLFWQNQRVPVRWTHRSRWWVVGAASSTLSVIVFSNYLLATQLDISFLDNSPKFLAKEKNELLQEFKQTYPLGLLVSLADLYQEQAKINIAFSRHQQFSFNAKASHTINNKQLVVLVIGETSRRANWQLNGYQRQTNPLLSTQANVVNFTDMVSLSAATRSSIPMLLTRKPAEQVYQYDFSEKSIISAFKESGFDTYWVSTQQKFGAFDTSTSVYAKEADHIIFLNKTNYTNKGETDRVVLPVFKKILANQAQKTLVVIHTLGSHFDYSHRYPSSFDRFKPSLNDIKSYSLQDKKYKQQIINSYDNSILYTDHMINELINMLKTKTETESFLLYSSDHGEDLFDGQCDKSGHGNETPYNFEIASLAWYSKTFEDNNPNKIKNLIANKTKKVNQTSIFPTLIDAANINIPNYQRTRSLLSDLSPYPRLVLGSKDYDNSKQRGICREIQ